MKNSLFLSLVLSVLTLSAFEAQSSIRVEEVPAPAVTAELPVGSSLPILVYHDLHPAVIVDIEAGQPAVTPFSIGSVLDGYPKELEKPPANSFIRPAYRSWLR